MEEARKKCEASLAFLRLRTSCCGCADLENGTR